MDDGIFLIKDGVLRVLEQTPFESEDLFQRALAEFPQVIAGSATTSGDRQHLLLVTREMGVPKAESAGSTWSLDHLFLDAEGVPVLVEVKRSTDTRIRREVVGQMLDYAANAVVYWPVDQLKANVDARAREAGTSAEALLQGLREDIDEDAFWRTVVSNLSAGRIRMVFVADALPTELVRIIEFLNGQMSPAEVLGIELPQFRDGDIQVLVPRVVGRTAAAQAAKQVTPGQQWDEPSLLTSAQQRRSPAELQFIRQLLEHHKSRGTHLNWGKGVTPGVAGWYRVAGSPAGLWYLNINNEGAAYRAYLQLYFADLLKRLPDDARLRAASEHLRRIPAMASKIDEAEATGWARYPSVYLPDVVAVPDGPRHVMEAVEALIDAT